MKIGLHKGKEVYLICIPSSELFVNIAVLKDLNRLPAHMSMHLLSNFINILDNIIHNNKITTIMKFRIKGDTDGARGNGTEGLSK